MLQSRKLKARILAHPNAFADLKNVGLVIARTRLLVTVAVLFSICLDPTIGGLLGIGQSNLIMLSIYAVYGLAAYFAISQSEETDRILRITAILDIIFAGALTLTTEGPTSPAPAFFLFSIVATGCWAELRYIVLLTILSLVLYSFVLLHGGVSIDNPYLMRVAYLAIAGYFIVFLGQQREEFQNRIRTLEADAQRISIARSLHDDYMQALAAISLRLEACRDMVRSDEQDLVLTELAQIQAEVSHEYDKVRQYIHNLANVGNKEREARIESVGTEFSVQATFAAKGNVAEHVILIMLEAIRNAIRHSAAQMAKINVCQLEKSIRIVVEDDGVGLDDSHPSKPWTITSRVIELGGRFITNRYEGPGVHFEMTIPT